MIARSAFLRFSRSMRLPVAANVWMALTIVFVQRVSGQDLEHIGSQKAFNIQGGLQATTMFYGAKGIPSRYQPFNYVISGSPVLSFYGIQMPFSFSIGKQNSSFTQPFNQFGLSPTYKWATVHLGYRNLNFSPLTLGGHTMLGAGFEINPGRFRLAFMYGRLNKATAQDTASQLFLSAMPYRRTGFSARVGYGTEERFVDLILLKAKDDSGSLQSSAKAYADSLALRAASNMVVGINARWAFWKRKLSLEAEGAMSLYTFDQGAAAASDSLFSGPMDKLSGFTGLNTSSEVYQAVQVALAYKVRYFGLRVQYRYVAPGYQSMGAYFLNNDLENITIAPSFSAWKGKIRFNGSLGLQRDDLNNRKRARAKRVIGSANLSSQLNDRLGLDFSFSNYSINQTVKTIRYADSLKLVQSSMSLSLMPRYQWANDQSSHIITAFGIVNRVNEINPVRQDSIPGDIQTTNLGGQYQWTQTQWQTTVMTGMNYTIMDSKVLKEKNWGPVLSITKIFSEQGISLTGSGSYLVNERNGGTGRIVNLQVMGKYQFQKHHAFRISGYYLQNSPETETADYPRFSEWRGEAGYMFTF